MPKDATKVSIDLILGGFFLKSTHIFFLIRSSFVRYTFYGNSKKKKNEKKKKNKMNTLRGREDKHMGGGKKRGNERFHNKYKKVGGEVTVCGVWGFFSSFSFSFFFFNITL
eukprot:TRINITY_DN10837_c0_g1_i1.p1 TRINITY_DN10837_c0_g1~~TRINITY_DN10837_c0_g1_i1.p1  ORF type:complete len:111 (+),score=4.91 TRINITY_DN10837_c0_g1_i1:36-368(+)